MTATSYTINIPQFVGPFDLLLFFIERDELDINDIPIAKITNDFLGYIRQMEALNIDLASEFILVAATLMRIKAKMLIPRKEIDEEGNEIDPRDELVARLLEYKRYKSVLEEMRFKEEERSMKFGRGNIVSELKALAVDALVDMEMESLSIFKLMTTFQNVMARMDEQEDKIVHRVFNYKHTIQGQQIYILSRIKVGENIDCKTLFSICEDRMHAIVTFLGLLELMNLQTIKMVEGIGINNFWLTKRSDEELEEINRKSEYDEEDNGDEEE